MLFTPCAGGAPVGALAPEDPSEEALRPGGPAGGDCEATSSPRRHSAAAPPPRVESDYETEENRADVNACMSVLTVDKL